MERVILEAPATLVMHWRMNGEACSEEVDRLTLTAKSVCTGELSIDQHCLSLWDGEQFFSRKKLHLLFLLSSSLEVL